MDTFDTIYSKNSNFYIRRVNIQGFIPCESMERVELLDFVKKTGHYCGCSPASSSADQSPCLDGIFDP